MTARQLRSARGGAASAIAVLLAAVSHTYGGGQAPGPWIVLAVTLLAWPVATLLAARRLGLWGLASGMVIAQLLLHTAFAVTGDTAPVAQDTHHHAGVVLSGAGARIVLPDTTMLAAHGVAAVAAFLVLGFGARAWRIVASGVRRALARATSAPLLPVCVRSLPAGPPVPPITGFLRRVLRRRGPPRSAPIPAS